MIGERPVQGPTLRMPIHVCREHARQVHRNRACLDLQAQYVFSFLYTVVWGHLQIPNTRSLARVITLA